MSKSPYAPKDFAEAMVIAIYQLAGGQDLGVPWKQVQDEMLRSLNLDVMAGGIQASSGQPFITKQIQSCWRYIRDKQGWGLQAKAGRYALTSAGVAEAIRLIDLGGVKPLPVPEQDAPAQVPLRVPPAALFPAQASTVPVQVDSDSDLDLSEDPLVVADGPVVGDALLLEPDPQQVPMQVELTAEVPVIPEPEPVVVPDEKGESWNFVIPHKEVKGGTDDPYLLSLQVSSVPCYGHFSDRSNFCSECPIRIGCFEQIKTQLAQMQHTFALQEAEEARLASTVPASYTDQDDGTPEPPKRAKKPVANVAYDTSKAEDIIATLETACVVCGNLIQKNEDCKWIAGVGVFHLACFPG